MKKILILLLAFALCFSGCGSDSPSEEPSNDSGTDFEDEGEMLNENNGSGTSSEEAGSDNPDDAIIAKYLGDWSGLLQIYEATGDYAGLNNVVTGACARIVVDDNGELFPFIGLNLSGFYIMSAYYTLDYDNETIVISGDYNSGNYENVEIIEDNGTLTMVFPSIQPNGQFYFKINLRRIGDENWTNENPGFSQGDLDYARGKTFEDIAGMMGYNSNHYPPAEMLDNGPVSSVSSGKNTAEVSGEKSGADGIVSDYNTIKNALEFCKTERTYDTTYDEIAAQFGVHGFHVDDFDASGKTMRRYRWFFDDDNRVTVTFEVKPDGTETWNITAWDGFKD